MKKIFLTTIFSICFGIIIAQTQEIRIGYIDKQVIINAMPQTVEAEKKYQSDLNLYNAEYDRMTTEYHKKVKEYMENGKNMKEAIKMALQTEITEYEERLAMFKLRYTKDLNGELTQKMLNIDNIVAQAIKQVAENQKISIVFDQPTPLYVNDQCINLTELIKKELNIK